MNITETSEPEDTSKVIRDGMSMENINTRVTQGRDEENCSRKLDLNDTKDFSHMGKGISYCPLITEDTLSTDQDHDKTVEE